MASLGIVSMPGCTGVIELEDLTQVGPEIGDDDWPDEVEPFRRGTAAELVVSEEEIVPEYDDEIRCPLSLREALSDHLETAMGGRFRINRRELTDGVVSFVEDALIATRGSYTYSFGDETFQSIVAEMPATVAIAADRKVEILCAVPAYVGPNSRPLPDD